MEKTISVEERIKRAEQIYQKRQEENIYGNLNVVHEKKPKKDVKILKKMIGQIIFCVIIYTIIYVAQNSEEIFSKELVKKVDQILSYDTNFVEIYEKSKNKIMGLKIEETEKKDGNLIENQTQEQKDIENIKKISFIKPVEGKITSKYGHREIAPKNHTGVDIANIEGTNIVSATDGEVVLVSEEGDYGKHLKIQSGEISVIYAHCSEIIVKHGNIVKQGQEIAKIGSTGNSTGPHLHFEIRYQERTVDPEKILDL